ncbi:MAG: B12-binding domain-containing radical SAM protein [Elusimicrobia bacterium]|nr:B12-binding domain-containing radical SAM protein [Elusimicrobiota bacterium]
MKETAAVFINPVPGGAGINEATAYQPLGLAYMAAALEREGFVCAIVDANVPVLSDDAVLERLPPSARLVGLHLDSFTYDAVKRLAPRIRARCPGAAVALGGALPTAAPEMALSEIACDGVVRGEGEHAVVALMRNLASGRPAFDRSVSGACFLEKGSDAPVKNPVTRITDLDGLPFPAYHLLPPFTAYKRWIRASPSAPLITSRGCAYDCSFCSKDIFERRVTHRSAANVLDEIDLLVKKYGIRQLDILDDNFIFDRARAEAVFDGLIARGYELAVNLQGGVRSELVDGLLLDKMKRAGVYKLAFGIESADETVLKLARKRLDLGRLEKAARLAKRKGFLVCGFFIVGLPGETEEGFNRTLEFARRLDLDVANFCMATPFVGTELYRLIEKNGRFLIDTRRNISSGFYGGRAFFEYGGMTAGAVAARYRRAYREFYSFGKKLRLFLNIRSLDELLWFWNIWLMLFKKDSDEKQGKATESDEK